jgi:perosamine synthetase
VKSIPITKPSIDEEDLQAVAEVLASGQLVQGPRVAEFERVVAQRVGTTHAVAVTNCTAALQLALLAVGMKPGDRVAVPTYSWPATANAVVLCGATPIFIEIERSTYGMDPDALRDCLREVRCDAVVPVHPFGGMCRIDELREISTEFGLPVIDDAACALGASHGRTAAGAWGSVGCFSFHPRKAITTGEGGMLTTNDDRIARTLRILRNHGQDPDVRAPDFVAAGFNTRLTEFQAALGLSQMRKLERIVNARRERAGIYRHLLEGSGIEPPLELSGSHHVYQSFVVLLPQPAAAKREEIIKELQDQGIQTTVGTYHMPLIRFFRSSGKFSEGSFPITDQVASRALTLPLYEGLAHAEQQRVVDTLVEAVTPR